MKLVTARQLLSIDISQIRLEELQKLYVRIIDAWRESTAQYGYNQAIINGFYKNCASESASGFIPSDMWLSHNLKTRLDDIEKRLTEIYKLKEKPLSAATDNGADEINLITL